MGVAEWIFLILILLGDYIIKVNMIKTWKKIRGIYRGRHLDPENRDFGIGIEKNGVGTGRDGVFDPDFFRDGTGWGFSIPIFSGRDGIEKKLNRDPDLMIFSSFFC